MPVKERSTKGDRMRTYRGCMGGPITPLKRPLLLLPRGVAAGPTMFLLRVLRDLRLAQWTRITRMALGIMGGLTMSQNRRLHLLLRGIRDGPTMFLPRICRTLRTTHLVLWTRVDLGITVGLIIPLNSLPELPRRPVPVDLGVMGGHITIATGILSLRVAEARRSPAELMGLGLITGRIAHKHPLLVLSPAPILGNTVGLTTRTEQPAWKLDVLIETVCVFGSLGSPFLDRCSSQLDTPILISTLR